MAAWSDTIGWLDYVVPVDGWINWYQWVAGLTGWLDDLVPMDVWMV
jgi:hypothetical protein